jgi:hypothetical protein
VRSSQALCISVFGTIAESPHRKKVMQEILGAAGVVLRPEGSPRLCCEVRERREVLNEIGGSNATCPDVLVDWPGVVLTIESKFTEHLGPCGQIDARRPSGKLVIKARACSGNHETGSDLRTGTDAACRLTVSENEGHRGYRSPRRYWEVASRLFRPEIVEPPRSPCPFADGKYQLMRNLCFAAALAQNGLPHRGFAFLLAYAGAAPSATESASDFEAFRTMLLPTVAQCVGAITYEKLSDVLRTHHHEELATWLDERLKAGVEGRST